MTPLRHHLLPLLLLWLLLLSLSSSLAQAQRTWNTSTSQGFWEDPANWVGGIVPEAGDAVILPSAAGLVTIYAKESIDINSLVSAGDYSILLTSGISISTSSLDVESTGKLSVQGGGSASPNSALGNITARSGSTLRLFNLVATAGSFSTNSNMVLQLSCTTLQLSAKMGVENVVDISGDSNSLLHFSGASALLSIILSVDLDLNIPLKFDDAATGTFSFTSSTLTLPAAIQLEGAQSTLDFESGSVSISGPVSCDGAGSIVVGEAVSMTVIDTAVSFTNAPTTLSVGNEATLSFSSATVSGPAEFSGDGSLTLTGQSLVNLGVDSVVGVSNLVVNDKSSLTFSSASVSFGGSVSISCSTGGSVNFSPVTNLAGISSLEVSGSGSTAVLQNPTSFTGLLSVTDSGQCTISSSDTVTLTTTSSLLVNGGTLLLSGPVTLSPSAMTLVGSSLISGSGRSVLSGVGTNVGPVLFQTSPGSSPSPGLTVDFTSFACSSNNCEMVFDSVLATLREVAPSTTLVPTLQGSGSSLSIRSVNTNTVGTTPADTPDRIAAEVTVSGPGVVVNLGGGAPKQLVLSAFTLTSTSSDCTLLIDTSSVPVAVVGGSAEVTGCSVSVAGTVDSPYLGLYFATTSATQALQLKGNLPTQVLSSVVLSGPGSADFSAGLEIPANADSSPSTLTVGSDFSVRLGGASSLLLPTAVITLDSGASLQLLASATLHSEASFDCSNGATDISFLLGNGSSWEAPAAPNSVGVDCPTSASVTLLAGATWTAISSGPTSVEFSVRSVQLQGAGAQLTLQDAKLTVGTIGLTLQQGASAVLNSGASITLNGGPLLVESSSTLSIPSSSTNAQLLLETGSSVSVATGGRILLSAGCLGGSPVDWDSSEAQVMFGGAVGPCSGSGPLSLKSVGLSMGGVLTTSSTAAPLLVSEAVTLGAYSTFGSVAELSSGTSTCPAAAAPPNSASTFSGAIPAYLMAMQQTSPVSSVLSVTAGSVTVNGDGATLVSAMTVTVSGGASLGGSTTFLGPGTVQLSGQTTVSADIILDQQVKVEVSSSSTMSWSGDSFSATLQESTTLQVSGGGVLQPMGVFTFGPSTLLEATSGGMIQGSGSWTLEQDASPVSPCQVSVNGGSELMVNGDAEVTVQCSVTVQADGSMSVGGRLVTVGPVVTMEQSTITLSTSTSVLEVGAGLSLGGPLQILEPGGNATFTSFSSRPLTSEFRIETTGSITSSGILNFFVDTSVFGAVEVQGSNSALSVALGSAVQFMGSAATLSTSILNSRLLVTSGGHLVMGAGSALEWSGEISVSSEAGIALLSSSCSSFLGGSVTVYGSLLVARSVSLCPGASSTSITVGTLSLVSGTFGYSGPIPLEVQFVTLSESSVFGLRSNISTSAAALCSSLSREAVLAAPNGAQCVNGTLEGPVADVVANVTQEFRLGSPGGSNDNILFVDGTLLVGSLVADSGQVLGIGQLSTDQSVIQPSVPISLPTILVSRTLVFDSSGTESIALSDGTQYIVSPSGRLEVSQQTTLTFSRVDSSSGLPLQQCPGSGSTSNPPLLVLQSGSSISVTQSSSIVFQQVSLRLEGQSVMEVMDGSSLVQVAASATLDEDSSVKVQGSQSSWLLSAGSANCAGVVTVSAQANLHCQSGSQFSVSGSAGSLELTGSGTLASFSGASSLTLTGTSVSAVLLQQDSAMSFQGSSQWLLQGASTAARVSDSSVITLSTQSSLQATGQGAILVVEGTSTLQLQSGSTATFSTGAQVLWTGESKMSASGLGSGLLLLDSACVHPSSAGLDVTLSEGFLVISSATSLCTSSVIQPVEPSEQPLLLAASLENAGALVHSSLHFPLTVGSGASSTLSLSQGSVLGAWRDFDTTVFLPMSMNETSASVALARVGLGQRVDCSPLQISVSTFTVNSGSFLVSECSTAMTLSGFQVNEGSASFVGQGTFELGADSTSSVGSDTSWTILGSKVSLSSGTAVQSSGQTVVRAGGSIESQGGQLSLTQPTSQLLLESGCTVELSSGSSAFLQGEILPLPFSSSPPFGGDPQPSSSLPQVAISQSTVTVSGTSPLTVSCPLVVSGSSSLVLQTGANWTQLADMSTSDSSTVTMQETSSLTMQGCLYSQGTVWTLTSATLHFAEPATLQGALQCQHSLTMESALLLLQSSSLMLGSLQGSASTTTGPSVANLLGTTLNLSNNANLTVMDESVVRVGKASALQMGSWSVLAAFTGTTVSIRGVGGSLMLGSGSSLLLDGSSLEVMQRSLVSLQSGSCVRGADSSAWNVTGGVLQVMPGSSVCGGASVPSVALQSLSVSSCGVLLLASTSTPIAVGASTTVESGAAIVQSSSPSDAILASQGICSGCSASSILALLETPPSTPSPPLSLLQTSSLSLSGADSFLWIESTMLVSGGGVLWIEDGSSLLGGGVLELGSSIVLYSLVGPTNVDLSIAGNVILDRLQPQYPITASRQVVVQSSGELSVNQIVVSSSLCEVSVLGQGQLRILGSAPSSVYCAMSIESGATFSASGSGVLTLTGTLSLSGSLGVQAGALVVSGNSTFESTSSVNVQSSGTLRFLGPSAYLSSSGDIVRPWTTVSAQENSQWTVNGDLACSQVRMTHGGALSLSGAEATLTLSSGCTLLLQGSLTSEGTLSLESESLLLQQSSSTLTSTGRVKVSSGNWQAVDSTVSVSGQLQILQGATVKFLGGCSSALGGSSLQISGQSTVEADEDWVACSVPQGVAVGTLLLSQSSVLSVNSTTRFAATGALSVQSSSRVMGALTLSSDGQASLEGDASLSGLSPSLPCQLQAATMQWNGTNTLESHTAVSVTGTATCFGAATIVLQDDSATLTTASMVVQQSATVTSPSSSSSMGILTVSDSLTVNQEASVIVSATLTTGEISILESGAFMLVKSPGCTLQGNVALGSHSVFALQQGSVCQAAANVDISIQAADGSTNTTVLVTDPSSSLHLEADSLLEVHNLQVLNGGSLESQGSVSLATALILSGHGSSAVCSTSTCVLTTPLLTVQQNSSLSIDTSASLSVSASGSMQVLNGATVSVSSAGTILGLGSSITVSGLAATFSVAESAIFAPSNNPIQLVALAISDGGIMSWSVGSSSPAEVRLQVNGPDGVSVSGGSQLILLGSSVTDGRQLTLETTTLTLEGEGSGFEFSDTVQASVSLLWSGGYIRASFPSSSLSAEDVVISGSVAKSMSQGRLDILSTGTLNCAGASVMLTNSTWKNPAGSTLSLVSGSVLLSSEWDSSTLVNDGNLLAPETASAVSVAFGVNNTGQVTVQGGSISMLGAVSSSQGAMWNIENSGTSLSLLGGGAFESGTISVTSQEAKVVVGSGPSCGSSSGVGLPTFTLQPGATVSCSGSFVAAGADISVLGSFTSSFSTTVTGGQLVFGQFRGSGNPVVSLSGAVSVRSGVLRVSQTASLTGSLVIGAGDTAREVGILDLAAGSTVQDLGPDINVLAGGILNINGGLSGSGLQLGQLLLGGTLNFNGGGNLLVEYLTLQGGIVASTSFISVLESFLWLEGTLLGQGLISAEKKLLMISDGFKFLDSRDVVVKEQALWNGTSALTLRNGASLSVQQGATFKISSTGGLQTQAGGLESQFSNLGTVTIDLPQSADVFRSGANFLNQQGGILTFVRGGLELGSSFQFNNTGGTIQLNNQTIITGDTPLVVSSGVIVGPGQFRGNLSITNTGEIQPGTGLILDGNFEMLGSLTTIQVQLSNTSFSFFSISGFAQLGGRMEVVTDASFRDRPANETFVVMRYGSHGTSNFETLGGCNGIFTTKLLPQEFQFITVANSTLDNAYVSPLGSDASCCGTQSNPCESIQFTVETVAEGRTVFLEAGTYTSRRNCQVTIGKRVTIQGQGADTTIIDCSAFGLEAFLLNQGEGAETILADFSISNTSSQASGGGIVISNSSPTLRNIHLVGNSAAVSGGGIYITGTSQPVLDGVVFERNSAPSGAGVAVDGVGAQPSFLSCNFLSNNASVSGGGLMVVGTSVALTGGTMSGNLAVQGAGAFFQGSSSSLESVEFLNNQASGSGGGVFSQSSTLTLTSVSFSNNKAASTAPTGVFSIGGGAVFLSSSRGTYTSCTFSGNQAVFGGSVLLSNSGSSNSALSSLPSFSSCSWTSNAATSRGGAIFSLNSNPQFTSCHFDSNSAVTGGGALSFEQSNGALQSCSYQGNSASSGGAMQLNLASQVSDTAGTFASNTAGTEGGGIANSFSTLTLSSSSFSSCSAAQSGGSLWFSNSAVGTLQNVQVQGSVVSEGNGGALFLSVSASVNVVGGSINSCSVVTDPSKLGLGGAVYVSASSITLSGVTLQFNEATQGAGIYLVSANSVSISSCSVQSNKAQDQGGALYSVSSSVSCASSSIQQNSASNSGGAFQMIASSLTVNQGSFSSNSAGVGGAIYLDSTQVQLTGVSFSDNEATSVGGAVRSQLGSLTIGSGCSFQSNKVPQDGGAVWVESTPTTISGSTFSSNQAVNGNGGALFFRGVQASELKISTSSFTSNVAVTGGALYATGVEATVSLEGGSSFLSNSASSGGAVCLESLSSASLTGPNLSFGSNSAPGGTPVVAAGAPGRGGALYVLNCNALIQQASFQQNSAVSGGGIYLECDTASVCPSPGTTISGCSFTRNQAQLGGGALMWDNVSPQALLPSTAPSSLAAPHLATLVTPLASPASWMSMSAAVSSTPASLARPLTHSLKPVSLHHNLTLSEGAGLSTALLTSLLPNTFVDNSAAYGQNAATGGQRLSITNNVTNFVSVTSGRTFPFQVQVSLLDFYNNTVITDSSSRVEASGSSQNPGSTTNVDTIGSRVQDVKSGVAMFSDLGVLADPGTSVLITFSSGTSVQSVSLTLRVRNCTSGEILSDRRCQGCPEGTYDLTGSGNCIPCNDPGLDCSAGGDGVVAEPGYWLLINGNDVQAFQCPEGYCRGGNDTCIPGRDGVICADCVSPLKNWGSACIECDSYNWLALTGLFFLAWFYVAALLWIGRSSSGKFKILLYFAQTVQLILGPNSSILSYFALFNADFAALSGGGCIGPFGFYSLSLIIILLPLIFLLLLLMSYGVNVLWLRYEFHLKMFFRFLWLWMKTCSCGSSWSKSKAILKRTLEDVDMSERKANRDIYIHTFAFLLLFAYSTVTKTVLQFINCREVGPYKLVAAFPEVSCEAGAYKTWSAVYYTLLVVFVCFGPVGLLVLLIWARVKKRLYSERFSKRAGVLFICYRRGWFFWETIYLARRTLMIGLYVALFNKEEGRSFALSFACIVISAVHIAILPFEDQLENLAETISLNSLSVISVLQASQFSDTFEGDTNVLVAIFIIVPVAFVLYIMVKGFLRPILRPLWRWIRRVCCKVDPEVLREEEAREQQQRSEHKRRKMKTQVAVQKTTSGARKNQRFLSISRDPVSSNTQINPLYAGSAPSNLRGLEMQSSSSVIPSRESRSFLRMGPLPPLPGRRPSQAGAASKSRTYVDPNEVSLSMQDLAPLMERRSSSALLSSKSLPQPPQSPLPKTPLEMVRLGSTTSLLDSPQGVSGSPMMRRQSSSDSSTSSRSSSPQREEELAPGTGGRSNNTPTTTTTTTTATSRGPLMAPTLPSSIESRVARHPDSRKILESPLPVLPPLPSKIRKPSSRATSPRSSPTRSASSVAPAARPSTLLSSTGLGLPPGLRDFPKCPTPPPSSSSSSSQR